MITGFSGCGVHAPEHRPSSWLMGLVAPWHVRYSQTSSQTPVPCTGRWILVHCTTREVLSGVFKARVANLSAQRGADM